MESVKLTEFEVELKNLINKFSLESGSDTPDFILARYLSKCLDNYNEAVDDRESWYGRISKRVII